MKKTNWEEVEIDRLLKMLDEGKELDHIAKVLNRTESAVYQRKYKELSNREINLGILLDGQDTVFTERSNELFSQYIENKGIKLIEGEMYRLKEMGARKKETSEYGTFLYENHHSLFFRMKGGYVESFLKNSLFIEDVKLIKVGV